MHKEKRICRKKVILFLHGGGYIGKIRNCYRRFALELRRRSGGRRTAKKRCAIKSK